jgi:Flp pilus assembly protein TadD
MSLLLDALKRAEQAKKAKSDEAASVSTFVSTSGSAQPRSPDTPTRTAEKRVTYNGPERRELQLTDREGDVLPRETPSPSSALSKSPLHSPSTDGSVPMQAAAHIRRTNVPTPRTLPPAEAVQDAAPPAAASVNREIAKPVLVGRSSAAGAPISRPTRAPWLAPLIAVGFVAVGVAGWYGWQELSRSLSTTANRVPQTPDAVAASPATGQIAAIVPPPAPSAPASVIEPALPPLLPPPLPDVMPSRPTPITRLATSPNNPRELTERERLAQSLKQSPTGREAPVRLRLSQSIEAPKVSPELAAAYAALARGDYVQAKNLYSQVVQIMPLNLDAQIGLAASSARGGDNALAARHYRRALELDPRNSMAIAGLLAVSESASGTRPEALEAQLKALISKDPNAAPLQFALGNLYAQERRWTEAQQAFFEAYRLDAANADYLFNLAVSLDQLNQPRLAFDYYQKSLAQALKTGAQFDRNVAQRRAGELQNLRVAN